VLAYGLAWKEVRGRTGDFTNFGGYAKKDLAASDKVARGVYGGPR